MWKPFFIATALLLPVAAFAQAPAPVAPDPQTQALSQSVLDLTAQNVQLRAHIIALQQENAKLKMPSTPPAPEAPKPPSP